MKLVCICGDDTVASRERYFKIIDGIKKRGWEHISLSSDKKMSEQLAGISLFGGEKLYSCDSAQKLAPKEYEWIQKHSGDIEGSLLLYFSSSIPAAIKKLLPKDTKYEEFKLKTELFTFIDSVYPGNKKRALQLLHLILKTEAPELVVALLSRQLKDISWAKNGGEGMTLPPWRKQKLTSAANKYSWESLKGLVNELSIADVSSKTGGGELSTLLDLALIKYL